MLARDISLSNFFELLNLAINLHDIYCSKRRKMLVLTDCSILLGRFHFKFKTTLILKMIAVFTALKMTLSIRVQRLFALNLTQIKNNGNYLALKFLYFKFKLLIYDPKPL